MKETKRSILIAIFGPTGIGKTGLAVKLAKKFNGEILSVDSRQVYRGMDIVTGKDSGNWGVNLVGPSDKFSAADFVKRAKTVIADILKRGKVPILTVGTYFYFKTLVEGVETLGVKPDWELREKLEEYTVKGLQEELRGLDRDRLQRMNRSDKRNRRRLIRAIEVAKLGGRKQEKGLDLTVVKVGLKSAKDKLYEKIDKRVNKRIKMGAFSEAERLAAAGYGWDLPSMSGIGYRQLRAYFEKKKSKEAVIKNWKTAEHKYTRQQLTWLAKDKEINWFNVAEKEFKKEVISYLGIDLYKKYGIKNIG